MNGWKAQATSCGRVAGPNARRRCSAKTWRADIPYEDRSGAVFDFHALRHQFLTNLQRAGVHPKIAQALARHSTITLTMDVYSQVSDSEARAGVEALRQVAGA